MRTTPLHPQSDGLAERFNRTLLDYLAKFVDRQQSNWDKLLPLVLLSYRAAVHETTKFTPAMLNLGRELVLPVDLWRGSPPDSDRSVPHYVQEKINAMESIREAARNKIFVAAESMKRRYDHTANQPDYQKSQLVWLRVDSVELEDVLSFNVTGRDLIKSCVRLVISYMKSDSKTEEEKR